MLIWPRSKSGEVVMQSPTTQVGDNEVQIINGSYASHEQHFSSHIANVISYLVIICVTFESQRLLELVLLP